jgi:hypothetical protein
MQENGSCCISLAAQSVNCPDAYMNSPLSRLSIPRVPAKGLSDSIIPLHQHPEMTALRAEHDALVARMAEAEQRSARAKLVGAAPKVERSAADRARDLVAGGTIPSAEPRAELAASEQEMVILRAAIGELEDRRTSVVSRLNFDASKAREAENLAALRRLDAAFAATHAAVAELHQIYSDLTAAGFTPRTDVLPAPIPRAAYLLGDPATHGNLAAYAFRRWLNDKFGAQK